MIPSLSCYCCRAFPDLWLVRTGLVFGLGALAGYYANTL